MPAHLQAEERDSRTVWNKLKEHEIEYICLQFTDLFGFAKQLMVHRDEYEAMMEGRVMFDGSSVDGFCGVQDSDLVLRPDPGSFHIQNWRSFDDSVAAMYCDVCHLDGTPAEGCTRSMLKKVLAEAAAMGFSFQVGLEGEFFLFPVDEEGKPELQKHDRGGYFDVFPLDKGEQARMDILSAMKKQGFRIEASHHEVAPGQHEIDFRFGEALAIADQWQKFKQIVKHTAGRHGIFASFLPKPFAGQNGNAMHCNQSLQNLAGENVFYDRHSPSGLSRTAGHYIGGLLKRAKEMAAIANPIVNSYKRLLLGYEAPTHIAWSCGNRSALIRIPGARGQQTRVELRTPDPTANPYLLFAVMLKAGLDGIKNETPLQAEAAGNIYEMSEEERERCQIESYPRDLHSALEYMKDSRMIREVMGERTFEAYLQAKQNEARQFASEVHPWEIETYLSKY